MNRVVKAAFAAMIIMIAPAARAVDVKAGNWDLSFAGNVNAFATFQNCQTGGGGTWTTGNVILGQACQKPGSPREFSIESGLLPSAFVFTAKTTVGQFDTSATIGIYPGLHVSDTRTGVASGSFTADVRQNFLTFGNKSWGTVKLGKDLGVFGGDVILSDMLLFGVGAGARSYNNHNVTVGHIGTGYLYADWIPQFTYYSPSVQGVQLTLSVIEPYTSAFGTAEPLASPLPGFEGRLSYDLAGPVTARAWVSALYQHVNAVSEPKTPGADSWAFEAGAKASASGISGLLYGYAADGVGTFAPAALGIQVLDLAGHIARSGSGETIKTRKSYGYFAQLTAEIPNTKLKPGVSYGKSYLDRAPGEAAAGNPIVSSNGMFTAALFYALTPSVTLTAEYDHVRSKAHNGDKVKSNTAALGGIIFF